MTDADKLEAIREKVDRMYILLAGDPAMGQTGLISTTKDHARRIGRIEWIGSYVAAIGSLVVVAYKIAVDWLRK